MTAYEIFGFVAVTVLAQSPLVFGGSYLTACRNPSCPSVTWLDAAAGQVTNFTFQSSLQTSVNKYVAFAFATGQTMGSALLVVDCYDYQGSAMIGTSRNAMVGHQNVPSPGDLSTLSNRIATRNQNLLTCTFSMALPNSPAFILIAEGTMDVSSAPPVKTHHTGRYPSTATFSFIPPTTMPGAISTMSSAPTTMPGAIFKMSSAPTTMPGAMSTMSSAPTAMPGAISTMSSAPTAMPGAISTMSSAPTTMPGAMSAMSSAPTAMPGAISTMSSAPVTMPGLISTMSSNISAIASKNKATVPGIRLDVIGLACVIASSWMIITLNQGA